MLSYATNHIYHLAYNYKLSTNSLEIHKLSKYYLLDICVLYLSVTKVLVNASLLSYCQNLNSALVSLNWWLCSHWDLEKNNTTIDGLEYIDCVISVRLIHILRLRRAPLLHLAHLDTRMQHISVYEETWAKHTMALLAWINN